MIDGFMKKVPERCIDVGIAESHAVTFAGGIAYDKKMKVVVSIYSTFLQRAFDNLFHDVCLQENAVTFAIDRGGLAGPDGSTHNGIYDISFLNAMPNMIIAQPRNGLVLKELLESSFSWGRPAAIRYPNIVTEEHLDEPITHRAVAKGEVLIKGSEVLLIGLGHMNYTAIEVRNLLLRFGITATVLDPVFVKPLDAELLASLLETHHKIVTIEEHSVVCGLGSIINNFLVTRGCRHIEVVNFGVPEAFVEQGTHQELLSELGLTPEKITQRLVQQFHLQEVNIKKIDLSSLSSLSMKEV
jgi:1-deoxy-D-xylulose-5-phosphate synthase